MTNSTENRDESRERVHLAIWVALIGAGLVWWFYPQIRAAVQPERVEIAIADTVQDAAVEGEIVSAVEIEETPASVKIEASTEAQDTPTDAAAAVEASPSAAAVDVEIEEVVVAPSEAEQAPSVEPKQDAKATASVETETEVEALAASAAEPMFAPVAAPKFDLVRIEDDGSALIAGLAEGTGHVILSVDGIELSDARANLNGSGQFVIFAFLPSKMTPQALRLHLYTEDGAEPVISTEIVFVAAAPKVEPKLSATTEELAAASDTDTEAVPAEVAQSEVPKAAAPPTVIISDDAGVRILQDSGPILTVSIDTISYTLTGDVSIGGRAAGRGFVRIYLDNKAITTSRISDSGYWTVDLLNVEAGIYTLRVDELNSAGDVLSRTETPFKREKPAELVALMADSNEAAPEEMLVAAEALEPEVTTGDVVASAADKDTEITQTTVEVQAEVADFAASDTPGAELAPGASGAAAAVSEGEPAASDAALRAPSVTFRVKTVQPGSTLWAIAKESYGEGIEYFKVFEANKERIRDPDLIYPGQVFEIPD
jgi:nucleoid-associated protein YgaU